VIAGVPGGRGALIGGGVNCGAGLSGGCGSVSSGEVSVGADCDATGNDANAAASATATGVKRSLIDGSSCEEGEQPL